jgi:hypothetical protein
VVVLGNPDLSDLIWTEEAGAVYSLGISDITCAKANYQGTLDNRYSVEETAYSGMCLLQILAIWPRQGLLSPSCELFICFWFIITFSGMDIFFLLFNPPCPPVSFLALSFCEFYLAAVDHLCQSYKTLILRLKHL